MKRTVAKVLGTVRLRLTGYPVAHVNAEETAFPQPRECITCGIGESSIPIPLTLYCIDSSTRANNDRASAAPTNFGYLEVIGVHFIGAERDKDVVVQVKVGNLEHLQQADIKSSQVK